jgi:pimeloyl-ACP methyl ester carboxylesterase
MPLARVRGITINYEILGERGPWMALSPGGRRALADVKPLAERLAQAGYRVVLHDRRNCGASDVVIGGEDSEFEIWADDLHELLSQLNALPAIVGGGSSGARLSMLFALRHPQAVRALLLWRLTGGAFAVNRLARQYYAQYIEAAKAGGMAAVCATEHFRDRIEDNPSNRGRLMQMDPDRFIAVMTRWREEFLKSENLPVIGASEAELKTIKVPTLIIPGNDRTHGHETARTAHRFLANSEFHELFTEDLDVDMVPMDDWYARIDDFSAILIDFLRRRVPANVAA